MAPVILSNQRRTWEGERGRHETDEDRNVNTAVRSFPFGECADGQTVLLSAQLRSEPPLCLPTIPTGDRPAWLARSLPI